MTNAEKLARAFHDSYERLAPRFGYETRTETREFNPDSANGKLMIAVCGEMLGQMDLNAYARRCHEANKKWWPPEGRNKGEQLMLVVSELSEAMEGARKDLMDDKLPHRKMEEVELADALVRIFDYAAGHGWDVNGAFEEKMAYNAVRPDHKIENRNLPGGKKW